MAIRFRGMLSDFSQLEYGYCPPEAVPLEEANEMEDVLVQAIRQSVPLFILVMALSAVRLMKGLDWSRDFSVWSLGIAFIIWFVAYMVLILAHEWIHALFFPRRAVKDVWIYQFQAAMVYCNTPVKRTRFIVMSLAPVTILGFLPFIGWLLGAAAVSPVVSIFWMSMCWSMIFGGVGDFYNVRNVIQQVPRGAYVFNYGLHTYWIEDPRKKK